MNFKRRALYLSLKYLGGLLAILTALYAFKYGPLHNGTIITGITCTVTFSFLYALIRGVSVIVIAHLFIPILVTIVTLRIATTYPSQSPLSSWFPLLGISGLFFIGRKYAITVVAFCFMVFGFLLFQEHNNTDIWLALSEVSKKIPLIADFFIRFVAATLILLFALSYESQREEAEKEKKSILSSMKIGLWQTDNIGKTIYFDDQCMEILGLTSEKRETSLSSFVEGLPEGEQKEKLIEILHSSQSHPSFELTFKLDSAYVRVKGESTVSDHGGQRNLHGVLIDETEQEELRNQLKHQEDLAGENARLAAVGQLAAGLGHEINNPLAIIIGYTKKIEREFEKTSDVPEKWQRNFAKIKRASERIKKIVHGLRSLSRTGDHTADHFNVNQSIRDIYEMIFDIYQKEGINLTLDLEDHESGVKGDESKFYQILMNLISNAKDAALEANKNDVKIHCRVRDHKVYITVINEGDPIKESVRPKLFVPFFTTKPENKGTGLGLSLSHSFAESLEGMLYLEKSDSYDTRFCLVLPLNQADQLEGQTSSDDNKDYNSLKKSS